MEGRITKIYHILLVVGLIISVLSIFIGRNTLSREAKNDDAIVMSNSMQIVQSDDYTVYTGILQRKGIEGKEIAFYASHVVIDVMIGDKSVYHLQPAKSPMIHTVGYTWNRIPMRKTYAGQPIKIMMKSVYGKKVPLITVYYGDILGIIKKMMQVEGLTFYVGLGILFVGIVLLCYAFVLWLGKKVDYSLTHLAMFTLLLASWMILDCKIAAMLIPLPNFLSIATHVCLMIMPIPFVLFLRTIFEEHDSLIFGYCYVNSIVVVVRIILQIVGLWDVRQSLTITHGSMLVMFLMVVYICVKEANRKKLDKEFKISMLCVLVILLTTVVDIMYYATTKTSSDYTSVGVLFYSVIMGLYTLNRSRRVRMKERELEVYRKLAFVDELTGLYNRTAFQRDLENRAYCDEKLKKNIVQPTTILMFDLNELKKCNDLYGHEYGDAYISMVAKELGSIFGMEGKCYRIGGDEFCAILNEDRVAHIENMVEYFYYRVNLLNRTPFVVRIQAAAGYALYDEKIDQTLEDTKNRADKMMYDTKQKQKQDS